MALRDVGENQRTGPDLLLASAAPFQQLLPLQVFMSCTDPVLSPSGPSINSDRVAFKA